MEFIEVHFDEKSIIVKDYKAIKGYGIQLSDLSYSISEKGQCEELGVLFETLNEPNGVWPISLDSILETTNITFQLT